MKDFFKIDWNTELPYVVIVWLFAFPSGVCYWAHIYHG